MTPQSDPMTMPTEGSKDHVKATLTMPIDVQLALDEGNKQIQHMMVSPMDYSSGMVKLTPRQFEILRGEIHARYSSR